MSNNETMHIGELAERIGFSIRTIRHYDEIGLIRPSGRTEGGFRLYTPADEGRFLLIRSMKPLGYSLDEVRSLLEVIDALVTNPGDEQLIAQLDGLRADALERRDRLSTQLAAADEFLEQLASRR